MQLDSDSQAWLLPARVLNVLTKKRCHQKPSYCHKITDKNHRKSVLQYLRYELSFVFFWKENRKTNWIYTSCFRGAGRVGKDQFWSLKCQKSRAGPEIRNVWLALLLLFPCHSVGKRVIHCSQARWHTQHARHLHPILQRQKVKWQDVTRGRTGMIYIKNKRRNTSNSHHQDYHILIGNPGIPY